MPPTEPLSTVEALPADLLRRPLDFLSADHTRQRTISDLMEKLADDTALDPAVAEGVLRYLKVDMAAHVGDEEEDLFPLLRKRCLAEDEIETALALLAGEHKSEERLAKTVIAGLQRLIDEDMPARSDPPLRDELINYARHLRRHLALEHSILLPMARVRLTARDLRGMAKHMAARRGISLEPPRPS